MMLMKRSNRLLQPLSVDPTSKFSEPDVSPTLNEACFTPPQAGYPRSDNVTRIAAVLIWTGLDVYIEAAAHRWRKVV